MWVSMGFLEDKATFKEARVRRVCDLFGFLHPDRLSHQLLCFNATIQHVEKLQRQFTSEFTSEFANELLSFQQLYFGRERPKPGKALLVISFTLWIMI